VRAARPAVPLHEHGHGLRPRAGRAAPAGRRPDREGRLRPLQGPLRGRGPGGEPGRDRGAPRLAALDRAGRQQHARRAARAGGEGADPRQPAALLDRAEAGTFHLDGNAEAAWSYDRLVLALRARFGDASWVVEPTDEYVHDQRLLDDRVGVASIAARL
jgi:hypothetical protein